MMDRITLRLDGVLLNDDAVARNSTINHFRRSFQNQGCNTPHSLTLQIRLGDYTILTLIAHCQKSGRWFATRVAANLPALLWGHNGRPLRSQSEVTLALTRLVHLLAPAVTKDSVQRLIPGLGRENHGYIHSVEIMTQVLDPGHQLLRASHLARRPYQHETSFIKWGNYTKIPGQKISIRFYDKAFQWRDAISNPDHHPATRIEVVFNSADRLGLAAADSGVVTTLTLEKAYAILRQEVGNLYGFGSILDVGSLPCSKTAKNILIGLGNHDADAHEVDRALEEYREICKPTPKTFKSISRSVRDHVVRRIIPDPARILSPNPEDVHYCDVIRPMVERDYQLLLRDLRCPMEPDPDIEAAWSATRFLPVKPSDAELSGSDTPGRLPFLTRTL